MVPRDAVRRGDRSVPVVDAGQASACSHFLKTSPLVRFKRIGTLIGLTVRPG